MTGTDKIKYWIIFLEKTSVDKIPFLNEGAQYVKEQDKKEGYKEITIGKEYRNENEENFIEKIKTFYQSLISAEYVILEKSPSNSSYSSFLFTLEKLREEHYANTQHPYNFHQVVSGTYTHTPFPPSVLELDCIKNLKDFLND